MIIITESSDVSTNKILEWLYFFKVNPKRINVDTSYSNFNYQIYNHKKKHNFENITFFNRRGYLPIIPIELKKNIWFEYLKKEQFVALLAFENINSKNYIGSYHQENNNNKILNLFLASKAGLNIPDTIVTNNRIDLLSFIKNKNKYITKSLQNPPNLETKDYYYYGNGTVELNIHEVPETFAPSLVQKYIVKEIEIRIFFIENKFYSMAIFSQNDEKTKMDYRKYNNEKPNRNVPFALPTRILNKIKKFIKYINCNTGSIDLILTPKGKYIFLEINPMGQYDWLSQNCNYYIDKEIAELLINKSKNGKRNNKKTTT